MQPSRPDPINSQPGGANLSGASAEPDRGRAFRIASWNVLYSNASNHRVVDFLETMDADVVALQELSQSHLAHLDATGRWHVVRSPDQSGAQTSSFLGLVSKTVPQRWRVVDMPVADRSKRSLFARLTATSGTQTALLAEWEVGGRTLQVLNLHLTCATSPEGRRRERAAGLAAMSADVPGVVLGDLNAMARRWISPAFAIPFGYRPRDLLVNELSEVAGWAAGHGFAGGIDGVTFPWLGLQLDQIFVRGATIVSGRILKHRFGSDHRPVVVDLAV